MSQVLSNALHTVLHLIRKGFTGKVESKMSFEAYKCRRGDTPGRQK